jgi:hypothetical protein
MPFPSSIGTTPKTLSQALINISALAGDVKAQALRVKADSIAGPISAYTIIQLCGLLADRRDAMASLASTPGINAYAQGEYASPTLDIVSAYNEMVAQIDATRSWITTNFPKSGTGELLSQKFDGNGRIVYNTFSTATLATFRTQIDALIATIN